MRLIRIETHIYKINRYHLKLFKINIVIKNHKDRQLE